MRKDSNKKKARFAVVTVCVMLLLTACSDPLPELTESETALVAEYAAGMLLKYNKNYTGKIVNDEVIEEQLRQEKEFEDNTEKFRQLQVRDEEETAEQDGTKKNGSGKKEMTVEELAQFLKLGQVSLSWQGYRICDSWPEEESPEEAVFAMTATPGNKFCVLQFLLSNQSAEDALVNIYDAGYRFSVIMNDSAVEQVQATWAIDDLAVFRDTIPAGESRGAVLILELSEEAAANIETLRLTVKGNEGSASVILQ